MGVPGFFSWLLRNKKKLSTGKLIISDINKKVKYLMLDTNCLLHPCVNDILDKYKKGEIKLDLTGNNTGNTANNTGNTANNTIRFQLEELIWEKIQFTIGDMIERLHPEFIYIAIDGVAPMGKILQQRQRRYKYLYDKKIKLYNTNEEPDIKIELITQDGIEIPLCPISSIELTPGTDYMERIHIKMLNYVKELENTQDLNPNPSPNAKIKYIYSSYHVAGEGEHKILQYIKNKIDPKDPTNSIVIYGLDADLLFLSLSTGIEYNLYVMREQQIFNNTPLNMDDYIDYNYVEISKLHAMIEKLNINTNDFITICYLIGNDFLPPLLTTDIKRGGLDKILTAYDKVKEQFVSCEFKTIVNIEHINNKPIIKINHDFLKELYSELQWTEKYTWKNINRDKIINRNDRNYTNNGNNMNNMNNFNDMNDINNITQESMIELKNKTNDNKLANINKFISGESANIECLEKIEFGSGIEYYNYYLGLEELTIDKNIIKNIVKDYITGIEWCINYYFNDCISWRWGYNYMIAPLITDIVKYYPKKIIIKNVGCELQPIEQLILAIPTETYKYVISKKIIDKLKKHKRIGYMFPESYEVDINKESIYWKCQVKIPNVEYDEYINVIKLINIIDDKNKIENIITNY